jgi:hypothetical protein
MIDEYQTWSQFFRKYSTSQIVHQIFHHALEFYFLTSPNLSHIPKQVLWIRQLPPAEKLLSNLLRMEVSLVILV